MKIIDVNKNNFETEVLNSDIPVLVDFNADWCGPCQMLKPIIEELSDERSDCKFVSINIDDEDELAEKFNVVSIPCLVYFKNGQEVSRSLGLKPKEEIEKLIGEN